MFSFCPGPSKCKYCTAFDSAETCADDSKNSDQTCGSQTTRCVAYEQEDQYGYYFYRGCSDEATYQMMVSDCSVGGALEGKCRVGFCEEDECKAEVA